MKMHPSAVQVQCLRTVMVTVLLREDDLGAYHSECLAPLAQKEQAPRHGELAEPMRETQVGILLPPFEQDGQALGGIVLRRAVLRGTPSDEVAIHHVGRDNEAVTTATNVLECGLAVFCVGRIPPADPDPPHQTACACPGSHQRIVLPRAEL